MKRDWQELVGKGAEALDVGAGFARGLTVGERAAQEATTAQRALQYAGWGTRQALRINSINTAAGWSIGGLEWGIKQAAVLAGNQQVIDLMDKAMWEMPLSMNPGVNIMTAFSAHPLQALGVRVGLRSLPGIAETGLLKGKALVGTPGSLGYVGAVDLGRVVRGDLRHALVDRPVINMVGASAKNSVLAVGDRLVRLNDQGEEVLHYIHDKVKSIDDVQPLADQLGWNRDWMQTAFGEGNVNNLTLDDVKEALLYTALSAVRSSKGDIGIMAGMHLPDMTARAVDFMQRNIGGAQRVLKDSIEGNSTALVDEFKGQWWRFADLNDTRQNLLKARLTSEYDPGLAFKDFLSWVKASKTLRDAYSQGMVGQDAALTLRQSVNVDWLRQDKESIIRRFGPDDIMPTTELDLIKRFGGAVENRGLGKRLIRKGYKPQTRTQVEHIIDSIIEDEARAQAAAATPRTEAAAFSKGVDPASLPEQTRMLRISGRSLETIRQAEALPPEQLSSIAIPRDVLTEVARWSNTTADALMADPQAGWGKVFEWLAAKTDEATRTAGQRDAVDAFGQLVAERRAVDPQRYGAASEAAAFTRDYILNPIDRAYLTSGEPRYRRLVETQQALTDIEGPMKELAADPIRKVRIEEHGEQGRFAWPEALPREFAGELLDLIDAAKSKASEGDLAVLNDPALNPLLKIDALQRTALTDAQAKLLGRIRASRPERGADQPRPRRARPGGGDERRGGGHPRQPLGLMGREGRRHRGPAHGDRQSLPHGRGRRLAHPRGAHRPDPPRRLPGARAATVAHRAGP